MDRIYRDKISTSDTKLRCTTVPTIMQVFHPRWMSLLNNHLTSSLTYQLCSNIRTSVRSDFTVNTASSKTNRHSNGAEMPPPVDQSCVSRVVPIRRSTVSIFGGLCFPNRVDPVQLTVWTVYLSHAKDVTKIATALYQIYFTSFRWLQYRSWLT